MKDYNKLIDFVENNLGIKLLLYQKILLKNLMICIKLQFFVNQMHQKYMK